MLTVRITRLFTKGNLSDPYLNFDLLVAEQRDEEGNHTRIYHHLDLLITAVGQV